MADTKAEEELFWTMDEGGPNGDTAALTIKQGDRYYNFFGDDVYIIGELILKAQNQLLDELEKEQEVLTAFEEGAKNPLKYAVITLSVIHAARKRIGEEKR